MYLHIHTYQHIYTKVFMYSYLYIYIFINTYLQVYVNMYIEVYRHTYTYLQVVQCRFVHVVTIGKLQIAPFLPRVSVLSEEDMFENWMAGILTPQKRQILEENFLEANAQHLKHGLSQQISSLVLCVLIQLGFVGLHIIVKIIYS